MRHKSDIFTATRKGNDVFAEAKRHSGRVRLLKIALPAVAAVLAGLFAGYTYFATPQTMLSTIALSGEEGRGNVIKELKLAGYTKDERPYALTAQKAIQVLDKNGVVALEGIHAKLPVGLRGSAAVAAQAGVFDNITGRLQLTKPFTVETSEGMKAMLQSAEIDVKTGQMMTGQPVEIRRPNELLTANGMRILENGDRILFEGKVKLVIQGAMTQ